MHRLLYFCDNSNRISENAPGTIKEIGKKGLLLNIVNKGRKEISQWCKNPYRPMTRQIKNWKFVYSITNIRRLWTKRTSSTKTVRRHCHREFDLVLSLSGHLPNDLFYAEQPGVESQRLNHPDPSPPLKPTDCLSVHHGYDLRRPPQTWNSWWLISTPKKMKNVIG